MFISKNPKTPIQISQKLPYLWKIDYKGSLETVANKSEDAISCHSACNRTLIAFSRNYIPSVDEQQRPIVYFTNQFEKYCLLGTYSLKADKR
ncbi:hypothetical protein P5673_013379 [Acropora cervicornis]|uniref:Uncharacterized protein n=1 Tax=Acropora cervicornis TaxID=6130 RepID=A0AAD9QLS4_ACRCE|nr:hypothetical protein P5673_013379 [Acropora cervicornis]